MVCCSAFACSNRTGRNHVSKITNIRISFHRFPRDIAFRNKWITAVSRKDWVPSKISVLCSEHFTEDCFNQSSLKFTRLNKNAIPSLFPSSVSSKYKYGRKRKLSSGPEEMQQQQVAGVENISADSFNDQQPLSNEEEEIEFKIEVEYVPVVPFNDQQLSVSNQEIKTENDTSFASLNDKQTTLNGELKEVEEKDPLESFGDLQLPTFNGEQVKTDHSVELLSMQVAAFRKVMQKHVYDSRKKMRNLHQKIRRLVKRNSELKNEVHHLKIRNLFLENNDLENIYGPRRKSLKAKLLRASNFLNKHGSSTSENNEESLGSLSNPL